MGLLIFVIVLFVAVRCCHQATTSFFAVSSCFAPEIWRDIYTPSAWSIFEQTET